MYLKDLYLDQVWFVITIPQWWHFQKGCPPHLFLEPGRLPFKDADLVHGDMVGWYP